MRAGRPGKAGYVRNIRRQGVRPDPSRGGSPRPERGGNAPINAVRESHTRRACGTTTQPDLQDAPARRVECDHAARPQDETPRAAGVRRG